MTNTDLDKLEQRVAELRAQAAPSTQLIDALNAWAQALSRVDVQRALEVTKEAHTLAYLLQHHMGVAVSLARLSWLHLEGGSFDIALLEAHQAQLLAEQLHDYVLTTRSIFVLATAQHMAGNYTKAETLWRYLFDLAQANGDPARQADFLNSRGMLFEDQRDFDRALESYRRAHDLFVQSDDVNHILLKNNMAFAMTMRGQNTSALELAEQALQLCDPDWQVWRALILHTLGVVHMHLGEYDLARVEFDNSLTISHSPSGRKETAARVLLDIAKLELLNNRLPDAFRMLEQALGLATEIKAVTLQIEAQQALFRLYLSAHDTENANAHHEAYLRLQHKAEMERADRRMGLIRAEAEAERQRPVWLQESQQLSFRPFGPT